MIEITKGTTPLVLGLPHTGLTIPADILPGMNDTARQMADTDWRIHDLYAGLLPGASSVRTQIHRYVIDVNRDPGGHSLYPGQNTTGLCPVTDFDGNALYDEGKEPNANEIARRQGLYHAPYHRALTHELSRVRALHGHAILYDCHSIRSHIPFLFTGRLPDINIGTNNGTTCHPELEQLVHSISAAAPYTQVLNGRFKGGWTTRHYADPANGVHCIQMELAQSTYMQESPPWAYDTAKADTLRMPLHDILAALSKWRPQVG
ncbi:MAG: N-formylglutamate deformylase [Paracoccaceae bacterium]